MGVVEGTVAIVAGPAAIEHMRSHGPVEFVEETTEQMAVAEFMMMGLRLDAGVSESDFRERFGCGLRERFGGMTEELSDAGLIVEDARGVRLTARGRLLGNEVFRRFVEAAEHPAGTAAGDGGEDAAVAQVRPTVR